MSKHATSKTEKQKLLQSYMTELHPHELGVMSVHSMLQNEDYFVPRTQIDLDSFEWPLPAIDYIFPR